MVTTRLDLAKRITSLVHQRDALAESHTELLDVLERLLRSGHTQGCLGAIGKRCSNRCWIANVALAKARKL